MAMVSSRLQTLSCLFQLVQFVKCWQIFLELNFKRLYQSSRSQRKRKSLSLVFTSSTEREIRHFHVVAVQQRQRNVQKRVMRVQSCCFANLNLLLFSRSCCRRRRRCLSSLFRVVTKILSCRVNTTSRRGIKWLGICFGSIFLLFSNKSSQGPLS